VSEVTSKLNRVAARRQCEVVGGPFVPVVMRDVEVDGESSLRGTRSKLGASNKIR
jgi:hypothetical protein